MPNLEVRLADGSRRVLEMHTIYSLHHSSSVTKVKGERESTFTVRSQINDYVIATVREWMNLYGQSIDSDGYTITIGQIQKEEAEKDG